MPLKVDAFFLITAGGGRHMVAVTRNDDGTFTAEALGGMKVAAHGKTKMQALRNITEIMNSIQD